MSNTIGLGRNVGGADGFDPERFGAPVPLASPALFGFQLPVVGVVLERHSDSRNASCDFSSPSTFRANLHSEQTRHAPPFMVSRAFFSALLMLRVGMSPASNRSRNPRMEDGQVSRP